MTLTKTQITESIRQRLDFSKNESSDVIESLLEIIKDTLENGEDVMISGFGKFCVTGKKERKGRNPATGDDMILPKRRIVTFKCSGKLKEMINK
ncbi:MAG: integration host factor subunit alpha [Deltaproteobacteria bacterium]|nr:integration host factor subunit alpha [Deltaproteobacteria bacterium]MBW2011053.1 integration host factor subunit alpha [Deltaproteobacteria bacterium]MBW2099534.1 integration host factor subunit alpha [Deltaproteobacteria bacterium]